MFQLLPCSNCQRTFSLRREVPEDSLLKCPNCGNQFRLGDVLDAFYSPYIVLDDSPDSSTAGDTSSPTYWAGSNAAASQVADQSLTDSRLSFDNLLHTHQEPQVTSRSNAITDDVTELAADNVFESNDLDFPANAALTSNGFDAPAMDADARLDESLPEEEPLAIGTNQFESPMEDRTPSPTFVTKSRSRRRERGGFWSVVQVILGGAAAIPVTLFLLWYVFGQDLMDAGPTVAQFAPWIVPKKFHSPQENIPARPAGQRVPPPALGEGGFRNFDKELSSQPTTEGDAISNGATEATSEAVEPNNAAAAMPDAQLPDAQLPAAESPMLQIIQTVRDAKKTIDQWDPQAPESSEIAAKLFKDLAALSVPMASVPTDGQPVTLLKNDLKDIGRGIANKKELLVELWKSVLQQFSSAYEPTSAGRLYFDWAREVVETEELWIINNKTENYHLMIEVSKKMIPQLDKGKKFFCLATIMGDPPAADAGAPKIVRVSASFFQIL